MLRSVTRTILFGMPLVMAGQAYAQASAQADADASVTIIQPLTLSNEADLNFGRIVKGNGEGTVTISSSTDTVSVDGGGWTSAAGITTSRAAFLAEGEDDATISITVPASVTLDLDGGDDELEVELTANSTTATLGSGPNDDGEYRIRVGGSFEVDEDTAVGAYTGSFEVTVAYQ